MPSLTYQQSGRFSQILDCAREYAKSDFPILITGESGVGKELIAAQIHRWSYRNQAPYVAVNCGAIPASLFESEIFGHEKGAFTGAMQSYKGLARSADGGTLFLDEVGELDLALQAKLLRFMETREVRSVGSLRTEIVDTRIIAATNVCLLEEVKSKRFRYDLLQRLNVLSLPIPPLRERPEDIIPIAKGLLDDLGCFYSPLIFEEVLTYTWPGNIRELKNVLTRASVLSSKFLRSSILRRVLKEHVLESLVPPMGSNFSLDTLDMIEMRNILERVRYFGGNRKRTAESLGIAKSTLQEKLRRYQMARPHSSSRTDTDSTQSHDRLGFRGEKELAL